MKEQACVILRNRRLSWFLGYSQNCELWLSSSSCPVRLLSGLVCVRMHGATLLLLNGFSWNLIFDYLSKIFQKDPSGIKIWLRVLGTLHEELCSFMKSDWILLGMRNVSYNSCSKNQNIFLLRNFFKKSCHLWDVVKYRTGRLATHDNVMVHRKKLICMLHD